MEYKVGSLEMISCITEMRSLSEKLLKLDRNYKVLLKLLLSDDFISNEKYRRPSVKELVQKSGLSYSVIHKQLQNIFDDLMSHENIGIDYCIEEVEYVFHVYWCNRYFNFVYNNLPVLPRVGDHINFPFADASVGTNHFYVESIDHTFSSTKQTISIKLQVGFYNKYLAIRKDEEYLKGSVSFEQYFSMDDYKWEEKLGFRYRL